jgi:L-asparagine transporter-like permease
MFVLIGLPAAASIVNFVVLTSAASSANTMVKTVITSGIR